MYVARINFHTSSWKKICRTSQVAWRNELLEKKNNTFGNRMPKHRMRKNRMKIDKRVVYILGVWLQEGNWFWTHDTSVIYILYCDGVDEQKKHIILAMRSHVLCVRSYCESRKGFTHIGTRCAITICIKPDSDTKLVFYSNLEKRKCSKCL